MSCRNIISPITGKRVQSNTWNGLKSELNGDERTADKLYGQLASDNFKAFFGDWVNNKDGISQIRDDNGEPMLLFHSSTRNFDAFDEKFSKEIGFHFGSEIAAVERHYPGGLNDFPGSTIDVKDARADLKTEIDDFTIYPVFLNIRKLIEGVDYLDAEHNEEMSQEEYDTLYKMGKKVTTDELTKLTIAFYQKGTITRGDVEEIFNGSLRLQDALDADGYWYINRLEGKGEKSYVVFDTNNIKSIYNDGQYSLNSNEIYHNLDAIKSDGRLEEAPNQVLDVLTDKVSQNQINYHLKIINALQKTPRKKYPSNNVQGFYNDLIKQGVPKAQIDILKQHIIDNNIKEINTEDLMVSLAAEVSYTVEINTAKLDLYKSGYFASQSVYGEWAVYDAQGNTVESDLTQGDATRRAKEFNENDSINSSHYSNLSAPGGTNYTENEIATPQIIPSIKGHAQFATDNGIGWFRSDEKAQPLTDFQKEGLTIEDQAILNKRSEGSKTRRILEVQSDLFQKGRDKKRLAGEEDQIGADIDEAIEAIEKRVKEGSFTREYADNEIKNLQAEQNSTQNQFLQLLNKDNNWVTFFVKSIIQDSAKKEYEKVLFPTGNTASKVEGHTTLEEFKKQKEDRLKQLEKRREKATLKDSKWFISKISEPDTKIWFDTEQEANDYRRSNGYEQFYSPTFTGSGVVDSLKSVKDIDVEITQLKQELERVNGPEGFGALKPIYNFYENTVTNILKKQGFNPKLITDEYGNTWNEVSITSEVKTKIDNILFNLSNNESMNGNMTQALRKDRYFSNNGILTKNSNEHGYEDRWYFVRGRISDLQVKRAQESESRYESFMSNNNFNKDMFIRNVDVETGFPYLTINKKFNTEDAIEENNEKIHKDKYNSLISMLSKTFGFKEENIVYTTKTQFKKQFPEIYRENSNSTIVGDKLYFFTNNLTSDITVEELLHPFIYTVEKFNKPLFVNLLKEARLHYPKLNAKIQSLYSFQSQGKRDQELVTQSLSRVFNNVYENEEPKSFFETIKDLIKWMSIHINKVFQEFYTGKHITLEVTDLHPLMSLEQIAQLINATDSKFNVQFPTGSLYNISGTSNSFNDAISHILTDKRVEYNINEMFTRLPKALIEIKDKLKSTINTTEKQQLEKVIRDIEEIDTEDKKDMITFQLKGVITTAQIFNELKKNLYSMSKSDKDDNIKLAYYMSIYKTSLGLDSFKGIMEDLKRELEYNMVLPNTEDIRLFMSMLTSGISVQNEIDGYIKNLIKAPLLNLLVKSNEYTYRPEVDRVEKEIKILEDKLNSVNSQEDKNKIQNKLSPLYRERKKLIKKTPSRENLEKTFDGLMNDSNVLSYWLEAKIADGHPLINTLMHIVNDVYDNAASDMLNVKNEAYAVSEAFTKESGRSLRDMSIRHNDISDDILRIPHLKYKEGSDIDLDLDDKGQPQFTYLETDTLYSIIDNEYITEYKKLELLKKHYYKVHFNNVKNDVVNTKDLENWENSLQDFKNFVKKNSEREYTDKYYDYKDIMDTKIGGRTLRGITNNFYEELDDLHINFEKANAEESLVINDRIKDVQIELKKLRSDYNDDGSKKEGDALEVATLLKKYNSLRNEYGDYVQTDDNKTKYEFDLQSLKDKRDLYIQEGRENVYLKNLRNIQHEVLSQDYFTYVSSIMESINDISNELKGLAEEGGISSYLNKSDLSRNKKDILKEIRDITNPYKDDEGIIDGISLSSRNPDLVIRVKELQEFIEKIRDNAEKLTSISKKESNELYSLKNNKNRTIEQQIRFDELSKKDVAFKNFRDIYKSKTDELTSLFKNLSDLSTTTTTDYYDKQVGIELAKEKNSEKVIKEAKKFLSPDKSGALLFGTQYRKENGRWYQEQTLGGKTDKIFLERTNAEDNSGNDIILSKVIDYLAEVTLKRGTWWENNHYSKFVWNELSGSMDYVEQPIFIWEQQSINNKNFIELKPNRNYLTYKVKDELVNKKYDTTYRGIPFPKEGKYVNKKFLEIQKDPVKMKYLNYLTGLYLESQKVYTDNGKNNSVKNGFVMPPIPKTEGENAVNITNKILSPKDTLSEMFATNAGETSSDTSYLLGGSQSNAKAIPMRFTGFMESQHQTKNAMGAILLFKYHTSLYKSLNENLPIFEASKLLASQIDVMEDVDGKKKNINRGGVFGKIQDWFTPSNNENIKQQQKITEKSVLSKNIDDINNMFIYGQRMKPSLIKTPWGKMDMAKVSGGIQGFAAKVLFFGNFISGMNNLISTRLQVIINSGINDHLYTMDNVRRGNALGLKYYLDVLKDWTKLGNKSLIGQVLDYFVVLNENPSGELLSKSEFTILKNKARIASSMKQSSEFEALLNQFLTIADATTVKVNGKDIRVSEIEKIFEIKDGKFGFKDGVEFSKEQENTLRNKYQGMARKVAGAYRTTELSSVETQWMGRSAMFLTKYLISMLTNRFAGERWSNQERSMKEGYQRDVFNNMIEYFTIYKRNIPKYWNQLSDKEKSNHYKMLLEYGTLIILLGLIGIAGGNDDRKKLKENSWQYNMMLVALVRAKSEIEQFTIKGTDDLVRKIKTPFMLAQTLTNISKSISLVYPTIIGDDSAFYKQDQGIYEKGDSKLVATLLKVNGITFATSHPEQYLINFRNAQNR